MTDKKYLVRMRNKLLKLAQYAYHFGLWTSLKTLVKFNVNGKNKIIPVKLPSLSHPVWIRNKSSDEFTMQQIFIFHEYDFPIATAPTTIIDAGANIGLAAVYFASRFPNARIICLEPESNNFKLLQQNIAPYPNISAVQGGLWSKSTSLIVKDNGWGNWGFVVEECDTNTPGSIKAYSIPDILKMFSLPSADMVKIDIEGSEKEVLEAPNVHDWVQNCSTLVVEHHDRMVADSSASLFKVILQYHTSVEQKGENTICFIGPKRQSEEKKPIHNTSQVAETSM